MSCFVSIDHLLLALNHCDLHHALKQFAVECETAANIILSFFCLLHGNNPPVTLLQVYVSVFSCSFQQRDRQSHESII